MPTSPFPMTSRWTGTAEALMIQQHRFVDGRWWPTTVFMRPPRQLYLVAEPSEVYDIREETSFQGLFTMDYTSNGEDMTSSFRPLVRPSTAKATC